MVFNIYSSSATLLSRPRLYVRRALIPSCRSLIDENTNKKEEAFPHHTRRGLWQYDGVALTPPQFQLNVRIRCVRRRHSRLRWRHAKLPSTPTVSLPWEMDGSRRGWWTSLLMDETKYPALKYYYCNNFNVKKYSGKRWIPGKWWIVKS